MSSTAPADIVNKDNQNTDFTNTSELPTGDLVMQIRHATGLGWAMTELLGRCIVLKRVLKITHPSAPDFYAGTVILSPIRDQRERALSVMGRIRFLATQCGVMKCKIEEKGHNDGSKPTEHGKYYIDVLNDKVNELCGEKARTDEEYNALCVRINSLLYYWNEQIQVILQTQPPPVYNGYTVGRGFSTIRWYIGIGEADPALYLPNKKGDDRLNQPQANALMQEAKNALISEATLDKLLDHLQSISIYLQPLVPQALEYSLTLWGKAIIKCPEALSKEAQSNNKHKNMKRALIKQATIWHDLLTGERDPTTFIDPRQITRQFVLRLFAYSLPFLLFGLVIATVIAIAVILLQTRLGPSVPTAQVPQSTQSITDTIRSTITALIATVTTIPVIRTLWISSSKTATDFISKHPNTINTAGKNALDLFWQRSQQVAVNKKTLVSPRSNPPDVDDGD